MTSPIKVELRRTVLTPRGRRFPPRRVEVFHLTPSSAMNTDGEMEKDEFCRLREFVTCRFPGLQGQFIILRKGKYYFIGRVYIYIYIYIVYVCVCVCVCGHSQSDI